MSIGLVALTVFLALLIPRVIEKRAEPPDDLSAGEAVDLACFQGWTVDGAPAFVPEAREVFVSEMSRRDARAFLQSRGVPATIPADGLAGFIGRTFVVVARGTVTTGPTSDTARRGDGLVLVVDADGTVRYVGIGPPWNSLAPPNARAFPVPERPTLSGVSRARARIELGGKELVELTSPPGGLALRKITINPARMPADPSGTEYPERSVSLIYADGTGRPRLWLTQSSTDDEPRVLGRPLPLRQLPGSVKPYAWYAGTFELDGFLWHQAGRAMFVVAEPGPDLPTEAISRAVVSLARRANE